MPSTDVHIDRLRVEGASEAGLQAQLRLGAKLASADLRPSGLAPAQVLLVKQVSDPSPGVLRVDEPDPMLSRTWERAAREALAECLRQAVRPTNGRVPPGADAVLFRDDAEAWACWSREQVARRSPDVPWWTHSLQTRSEAPPLRAGESPRVAALWRTQPRLVPAIATHLAAWGGALRIVREMSETGSRKILGAVCAAHNLSRPSQRQPATPGPRRDDASQSSLSGVVTPVEKDASDVGRKEDSEVEEEAQSDTRREAAGSGIESAQPGSPPWRHPVRNVGGDSFARALAEQRPAHRELLGIAIALGEGAVPVRLPTFQAAWSAWRCSVAARSGAEDGSSRDVSPSPESASRSAEGDAGSLPPDGAQSIDEPRETRGGPVGSSRDRDLSSLSVVGPDTDQAVERKGPDSDLRRRDGETPDAAIDRMGSESSGLGRLKSTSSASDDGHRWEGPYTWTELGGVLYLVNVLDALDLPEAAQTPPVGLHVGGWAVLEALARTLLGPEPDALCPKDPLWRVLAGLDGRPPEAPAGGALEDVEISHEAYRIPRTWLKAPHVRGEVDGQWSIEDGRLRVWTEFGCVLDVEATDNPAEQVVAEWAGLPNAGALERAESDDVPPKAVEPDQCSPMLARWVARTAPYVRHRLAIALGLDRDDGSGIVDLLSQPGKVYATATHVDLVLPLTAARPDARTAGLDRSPGWWAAGGRVVRFHFREENA